MSLDENMLAAFADGELTADEAAKVEAEAARDPALAARIARLKALRGALAGAYDDILADPAPARLLAAVEAGGRAREAQVISLAEQRKKRAPPGPKGPLAAWGALAASLLLAFGIGRFAAPESPIVVGPGGLVAQGKLAAGLQDELAAAQGPDPAVRIGVSFKAGDGRYCRTFLMKGAAPLAGLACRDAAGWKLAMAMAAQPAAGVAGGYRTAGEDIPAPVQERMGAMIAGSPLDAAAEAKARADGWRAGSRSRLPPPGA
jgi:hypothetical protein